MNRLRFVSAIALALFVGLGSPPARIASIASAAAPDAKDASAGNWTLLHFAHPVVFTIAMDKDPALSAKITVSMADRLARNGRDGFTAGQSRSLYPVHNASIVPGGTMTVADLVAQCAGHTNTVGAFIVLPTASASSTDNGIVMYRSNTEVYLNVMAAQCNEASALPNGSASRAESAPPDPLSVVWISTTEHGVNVRTQVEFFPIAILTSVYLAFAPQRTTQTTTTTVFPTTAPIPPTGTRSSVQQQNQTVLNASGTASLQSGVLTAFAGSNVGTSIGAAPSPERQGYRAIDDAVGYIVKNQIDKACIAGATSGPGSQPPAFCSW